MCEAISEQISLFRSELKRRRFGDETLWILETILVSRDVRSLLEIRSAVKELLRSESICVMREIAEKCTDTKLVVVDFFIKAFALVGDTESCLALKYEALVLRDHKHFHDGGFRVFYEEWLQFSKDCLANGFYKIAVKGFESALESITCSNGRDAQLDAVFNRDQVINETTELRDAASTLFSSYSVQAQAAEYLKRRATLKDQQFSSVFPIVKSAASSIYRKGINRRNSWKLNRSQRLSANRLSLSQ